MTERSWRSVGVAVRARREALGLTQEAAAVAGRISSASWRLVEAGGRDSFRHATLAGVARALGWPPDALDRIRAGEDPATWSSPSDADDHPAAASGRLISDLAAEDPGGYRQVLDHAEALLERARRRRGDTP